MKNQNNNPNKRQYKNTIIYGQLRTVFKAFSQQPKTMLMVAKETNIHRANICRYIAKWKKQNKIYLVKNGLCKISDNRAGYYSTSKTDRDE